MKVATFASDVFFAMLATFIFWIHDQRKQLIVNEYSKLCFQRKISVQRRLDEQELSTRDMYKVHLGNKLVD